MTWVGKSLRSMHGWLLLGSMFFVSGAQGAQTAGAAQGREIHRFRQRRHRSHLARQTCLPVPPPCPARSGGIIRMCHLV